MPEDKNVLNRTEIVKDATKKPSTKLISLKGI